jgi:hypothetical protein
MIRRFVSSAIWLARRRASLNERRLNGAASPGLWQDEQFANRIGATSRLNVTSDGSVRSFAFGTSVLLQPQIAIPSNKSVSTIGERKHQHEARKRALNMMFLTIKNAKLPRNAKSDRNLGDLAFLAIQSCSAAYARSEPRKSIIYFRSRM